MLWVDRRAKATAGRFFLVAGLQPKTPEKWVAAGQAEIDAAKKDGRWTSAYDSPSKATFPEDFLAAVRRDKKAKAFFESLNKANLYAIAYRLQTAKKPETRQKRMEMILGMLAAGRAFH